jgi:hypothetical protein
MEINLFVVGRLCRRAPIDVGSKVPASRLRRLVSCLWCEQDIVKDPRLSSPPSLDIVMLLLDFPNNIEKYSVCRKGVSRSLR